MPFIPRIFWALFWMFVLPLIMISAALTDFPAVFAAFVALSISCLVITRSIKVAGFLGGITLFLSLIIVFHFGIIIPVFVFGTPQPFFNEFGWMTSPYLPLAILMCSLGMVFVQLGYEFGLPKDYGKLRLAFEPSYSSSQSIYWFWFLVAVAMLSAKLLLGWQYGVFGVRSEYLEMMAAGELRWFGISNIFCTLSSFFALAYAKKNRVWMPILVLVLSALPTFIFGDRGDMIVALGAIAVVVTIKGVRIPFLFSIAGIAFLVFIGGVLRHVRGGVEAYSSMGFLDPLYELGGTMKTVVLSMYSIDHNVTGYWLGSSYWDAFTLIVPNVGINIQEIFSIKGESVAAWLTNTFNSGGAGLGSSIFSEAYINFGILGVVIVPAIVGYAISKFESIAYNSVKGLVLYGVFINSVLITARSESSEIFRPMVWALCLLIIMKLIITKNNVVREERSLYKT